MVHATKPHCARTKNRKIVFGHRRARSTADWVILIGGLSALFASVAFVIGWQLVRRATPSEKQVSQGSMQETLPSNDKSMALHPVVPSKSDLIPLQKVPEPQLANKHESGLPVTSEENRKPEKPIRIGRNWYRVSPPSAEQLADQLRQVREFGLKRDLDDPIVKNLIENDRQCGGESRGFHPFALAIEDVHSLPLRMGVDCKLPQSSARILEDRSRKLRDRLFRNSDPAGIRRLLRADQPGTWDVPDAVPTLLQILQAERPEVRLVLVELLSRIRGPEASRALASRAVFDVSQEVRHAALKELEYRPITEYRDVLIGGLRYPWPAAADFAATALIALRIESAVPELVNLLKAPSPSAPMKVIEDGTAVHYAREMVRINHAQNCIVCHAISFDDSQLVRAAVPSRKKPLPPAFSPEYYRPAAGDLFVRADVTYLRQDFSLPQHVNDAGNWPDTQRFDYCVRLRLLSDGEWKKMSKAIFPYPQRDSVLFALRELTGEEFGDDRIAWQQVASRYRN
jgi:hypothetical protein